MQKNVFQAPDLVLVIQKKVHSRENYHMCYVCNKSFQQKSQLTQHRLTNSRSKTFKCDFYIKVFARRDDLKHHVAVYIYEKPFKCKFYEKMFYLKHTLEITL